MSPANQLINQSSTITRITNRLDGGKVLGLRSGMWLYMKVPLSPIAAAKNDGARVHAFAPMMRVFEELSHMTSPFIKRRAMARSQYRQFHLLMVNMPTRYEPEAGDPLGPLLRTKFPNEGTFKRTLLLGVQIKDQLGAAGLKDAIQSVVETIRYNEIPLSDYDRDLKRVSDAMHRAGLFPVTKADLNLAESWWNLGRGPDAKRLPHDDHMHFFSTSDGVRISDERGRENCSEWEMVEDPLGAGKVPGPKIPGHQAISFASVEDVVLDFENPLEERSHWFTPIIESGALAVSVRGLVEPASVTRNELRANRARYRSDIEEAAKNQAMDRSEQQEKLEALETIEGAYAKGGTASLVNASIVVAFDGVVEDVGQIAPGTPGKLALMGHRQKGAFEEMLIGASLNDRANPNTHDLPSQSVACSGLNDLARVGDKRGILLGFTERDRQPALYDHRAAYGGDSQPLNIHVGQTGSGKSMLMLWKVYQVAQLGRVNPLARAQQMIIDPKRTSDHSAVVKACGGMVWSLDQLATADGIFDPVRFSPTPKQGLEMSVSQISFINPWGTKDNYEAVLTKAIDFGINAGATSTGTALQKAYDDEGLFTKRDKEKILKPVLDLTVTSPRFRSFVGMDDSETALRLGPGVNYIKMGSVELNLPDATELASGGTTMYQKIDLTMVRMMVIGSAMALSEGGVIHLDEAWVFLSAGKSEILKLGRVARSQKLEINLYTQQISDALSVKGFISRGMVLPMEDVDEAKAALDLFRIEDEGGVLLERLMTKPEIEEGGELRLNWNSMRALREPGADVAQRGTIGIYVDLAGRAVPTEIKLPADFLAMASTNERDIAKRMAGAGAAV